MHETDTSVHSKLKEIASGESTIYEYMPMGTVINRKHRSIRHFIYA